MKLTPPQAGFPHVYDDIIANCVAHVLYHTEFEQPDLTALVNLRRL